MERFIPKKHLPKLKKKKVEDSKEPAKQAQAPKADAKPVEKPQAEAPKQEAKPEDNVDKKK